MQTIQEKNPDKAIVGANHESVKTNCRNIVQFVLLMQSAVTADTVVYVTCFILHDLIQLENSLKNAEVHKAQISSALEVVFLLLLDILFLL